MVKIKNCNELFEYVRDNNLQDFMDITKQEKEGKRWREYLYISYLLKIVHPYHSFGGNYKEYFEWSQCADPTYNKYYKILAKDLCDNIDKYEETYNLLTDEVSKKIFYDICIWRLTRRSSFLVKAYYESGNQQYFEKFEKLNEKEIFVDVGGYIGDSVETFIEFVKKYKKIYLYEPNNKNIAVAQENLSKYENIVYRNAAIGEKSVKTAISHELGSSKIISDIDTDSNIVDMVAIDEDIEEAVTFIKMDIEGYEIKALKGAKNHIKNDRPILAICLYHNPEDLWEIPLYIKSIVNEYSFYIRHYTPYHGETVLYAVPNERQLM